MQAPRLQIDRPRTTKRDDARPSPFTSRTRKSWHDIRFKRFNFDYSGAQMSDVVRFVPKAELERARLIREARAHYERVFPPADREAEPEDSSKR
jgi:hypothetical protein